MTKQYILNAIAKNWSVPALRNVYDTIIAFLHDVGLDAEVEGMDTNAQHRMAHRINRRLVLDNPRIPGSKDINDLYTEFMSMMAEHQTKYATLDEMYTDWDYMLKDADYMELPPPLGRDEVDPRSPFMDMWSDDEVRRTCGILKAMNISFDQGKPDSFYRRVKAELDKRGLKIPTVILGPPGPLAKYL